MCFLIQGLTQLNHISEEFGAKFLKGEFNNFKLLSNGDKKNFKRMESDGKVFPGSFAPVSIYNNQEILVLPMRYRVRPAGSLEEVPNKYNVFNARRDSLTRRKTWSRLIGKQHGVFIMKKFYEWVERDGKKVLIGFHPTHAESLYVPCLYDKWIDNQSHQHFYSFAVITDEPPLEVEQAGHDRCPIHLAKKDIIKWLDTTSPQSQEEGFEYWDRILARKTKEYFDYVEDYKIEREQKNPLSDKQLKLF